ncbi:hypothetical protein [Bradyrhizobium embrapense]|nr:hypothetical protein [Bradyrhizobium embrapense]
MAARPEWSATMQANHHHINGVEVAFVCAAAVSLLALIASVAWLLLR